MPSPHLHESDAVDYHLAELSQQLSANPGDYVVTIPSELGRGYIKNLLIEDNCSIRYFNFFFNQKVSFDFFTRNGKTEGEFRLLFNLDNQPAMMEQRNYAGDFNSDKSAVLLYSADVAEQKIYRKNQHFHRVLIIFTVEWLSHYAETNVKIDRLIHDLVTKNKPTILAEHLDSKNQFTVMQLANEMDRSMFSTMMVKKATSVLVQNMLFKIVERNTADMLSDQSLHYHTITRVEERISKSIHQKLQSISQLAVEFNLSLSTLKRHFRMIYGKNIYEYYQQKRMEWGKVQLEKGNSSIREIALQLGFYKINNFSIAFKQYFGMLPREFKNKNSAK